MMLLDVVSAFLLGSVVSGGVFWWRMQQLKQERDRAQGTVNALQSARSRFYSGISHELRTPLTLSMGAIESALEGQFGELSDHARSAFDRAQRNNLQLVRRIDQLLDLSHLDSGTFTVQREYADLATFIGKLVRLFEPVSTGKMITEGLDAAVPFHFDPVVVEKIMVNLLSNAVRFGGEGCNVRIGFRMDGYAEVTIQDEGPGISEDILDRLFDHDPSTGLGLELVHKLVAAHRGDIRVDSDMGAGTTFTLRLCPLREA